MEAFFQGKEALFAWRFGFNSWHTGLSLQRLRFNTFTVGVLVFVGLTAYDTQKIKSTYYAVAGSSFAGKAAIMGALTLYLDFINLFVMLMQLFGQRR